MIWWSFATTCERERWRGHLHGAWRHTHTQMDWTEDGGKMTSGRTTKHTRSTVINVIAIPRDCFCDKEQICTVSAWGTPPLVTQHKSNTSHTTKTLRQTTNTTRHSPESVHSSSELEINILVCWFKSNEEWQSARGGPSTTNTHWTPARQNTLQDEE